MSYWLMKSEPDVFGIDDLAKRPRKTTHWDGVRNFQARNFMRDQMRRGDLAFFYHSSCDEPGVAGVVKIVKEGYPDHTAWQKGHKYFDPDTKKDAPSWFMVDIGFVERFPGVVSLETLKATKGLESMVVTQKGSRLSVQPVTKAEYDIVVRLGRRGQVLP